jgi:hypothetical protein
LKTARERLPNLEEEIQYLDREQADLARLVKEKKLKLDLQYGEQQIDELRQKATALKEFIQRIDAIPASEKASGLVTLVERATLSEGQADFDSAIRLYEQVVKASPGQTKIKARLDQLKLEWEAKNDDHKKARAYIYETWPSVDVAGLDTQIAEARKALAVCEANGDKLTPRKLLQINAIHTVNLAKQVDALKRKDSEDNRNRAKALATISENLRRLHNDAATWVGGRKDT